MTLRILYASERPPYPFFLGGAARCAHRLMQSLRQDLGAECIAVGSDDYKITPWQLPPHEDYAALGINAAGEIAAYPRTDSVLAKCASHSVDCGYPIHTLRDFWASLPLLMDVFQPDLVWAQLESERKVLSIARARHLNGVLYVHDAEFKPGELRAIDDMGCHMVASSGFLADKVRSVTGHSPLVVYPASDWYFGTQGDQDGFITMINPVPVKGLDTFLQIAHRLPHRQFLLLESWRLDDVTLAALQERLTELPNVSFRHRVSDMREIYRQTKLLIVPSVWEEGFGMVAVEAQSCGIPVIASARGGLTEAVGDGGVLLSDYLNVDAWVKAIENLLYNRATYAAWQARAVGHAKIDDFSPRVNAARFSELRNAPAVRHSIYTRGVRLLKDCVKHGQAFRKYIPALRS